MAKTEASTSNETKTIERVTLQSLNEHLGEYDAIRSCAVVALYMLLKANSYTGEMTPEQFAKQLNEIKNKTHNNNWSRPGLSRAIRREFKAPVVSWILRGEEIYGGFDWDEMKKAGYLETEEEIEFFKNNVQGRSLKEIVSGGYLVAVTVNPNFGGSGSKNIHALIITNWDNDKVTVVDPDARNQQSIFSEADMLDGISPEGAGTIILPKS